MIDTDKYEGHSPAPWHGCFGGVYCDDKAPDFKMVKITKTICRQPLHFDKENGDWVAYDGHTPANIAKIHPDQLLIVDAPLLLAEVKQIHEILAEAFTSEAKHSGAEYLNMIARVTGVIE